MPIRSLSIAVTGASALQNKIDTISNNLANVNTTGFKRSRVNFADLFYQYLQYPGGGQAGVSQKPTGIAFGTGVRLVSTEKIFTQGDFARTDNPLDWSIEGEGFFRVTLPNSRIAFTRAGNFSLDNQGNIITPEGYRIEPQITVPTDIILASITVDPTGLVQGINPSDPSAPVQLGQINLSKFINPAGLVAIGDNLFIESPAAGTRLDGTPALDAGFGTIRQGVLEESNVDVIREMVDMIQTQRAFEVNGNSIRTADEILQDINNLRR